uniref:Acid phosphatase n=1 Tax=Rhabditophanes sp. KR3021 TaxID=114890 RepID=A0AC35U4N5_9BILA
MKTLLAFFALVAVSFVLADDDLDLKFVQAVWRHGDRSPTMGFGNDIYTEKDWHQGWGQLSPLGMQQHVLLGTKVYGRYVKQIPFLSATYQNHEIYVRSTDVNRTIISAMSNLIGMYNKATVTKGVDYPDVPEWPSSFIPIAVHTVDNPTDYVGNPDSDCPRRFALYDELKKTPEYKALMANYSSLYSYLTNKTGSEVNPENMWSIRDAVFIEKCNNMKIVDFINDTTYLQMEESDDLMDNYGTGVNLNVFNGLDIGLEIRKTRGGLLISEVANRINEKINALTDPKSTSWVKNLKYYVYSAHDTTVAATLAVLGIKDKVTPVGYPHYSGAVFFELYQSKSTKKFIVKIQYVYPPNGTAGGNDLTSKNYCNFSEDNLKATNPPNFCHISTAISSNYTAGIPLADFINLAAPYQLKGSNAYADLCANTKIRDNGSSSSVSIYLSTVMIFAFFTLNTLFL